MAIHHLIVSFFCLTTFSLNAQLFNLNDSTFEIGNIYRTEQNIRFGLGKWNILEESFAQLDSIAHFLIANRHLKVEVGVHLDTRGSEKQSQRLDALKAQSIVDYLIVKGVVKYRLTAVGYRDNYPLISADEISKMKTLQEQEDAHQKNRRVEFKIIDIFPLDKMEMNYDENGNLYSKGEYILVDSVECLNCYKLIGEIAPTPYFKARYTKKIKVGTWEIYHSNGKIKEFGRFCHKVREFYGMRYPLEWEGKTWPEPVAGYASPEYLKDGTWQYYDEQGNNIMTEEYVCGNLIHKIERSLSDEK